MRRDALNMSHIALTKKTETVHNSRLQTNQSLSRVL